MRLEPIRCSRVIELVGAPVVRIRGGIQISQGPTRAAAAGTRRDPAPWGRIPALLRYCGLGCCGQPAMTVRQAAAEGPSTNRNSPPTGASKYAAHREPLDRRYDPADRSHAPRPVPLSPAAMTEPNSANP